jgi:hypothetical protein
MEREPASRPGQRVPGWGLDAESVAAAEVEGALDSPDAERIAAEAQTARFAVLPLDQDLKLVGVPDLADPSDSQPPLLHLIPDARDLNARHQHLPPSPLTTYCFSFS